MYRSDRRSPPSVFRELLEFPYSNRTRRALFNATKDSEDEVQRLQLLEKVPVHSGCVNCVCWNDRGDLILTGSDDQHLVITHPFTYQVLGKYRTNHRANIFSAKFLPETGDRRIVSCSGDGSVLYTDVTRAGETQDCLFTCHSGTTYDVLTVVNDPHVFLTCGEDGTVRSFDLRIKNRCTKPACTEDVVVECGKPVTAMNVNPTMPCQLAVGCADSTVRLYDTRQLHDIKGRASATEVLVKSGLQRQPHRITSLCFSPEGDDLLVSYSSEHLYLFALRNWKETEAEGEEETREEEVEECQCGGAVDGGGGSSVRRLRLRGDWSDTGPHARPHSSSTSAVAAAPVSAPLSHRGRRVVEGGLIQRMTDVLSRMLSDPATRAALTRGGTESDTEPPSTQDNPYTLRVPLTRGVTEQSGSEPLPARDHLYAQGSMEHSDTEPLSTRDHSYIRESMEQSDTEQLSSRDHSYTRAPLAGGGGTEPSDSSTKPPPAQDLPSTVSTQPLNHVVLGVSEEERDSMSWEEQVERSGGDCEEDEEEVAWHHDGEGSSCGKGTHMEEECDRSTVSPLKRAREEQPCHVSSASASSSSPHQEAGAEGATSVAVTAVLDSFTPGSGEGEGGETEEEWGTPTASHLRSTTSSSCASRPPPTCAPPPRSTGRADVKEKGSGSGRRCCHCSSISSDASLRVKPKKANVKMKFTGHRNARTVMKEATFWGRDHVMSGSDCGHVLVWKRDSGRLVMTLAADSHVVNCLQPHPTLPLLATAGIDYDLKLWAPLAPEPSFDPAAALQLMSRNAIMLEETKDTITVPASFMIRMLACLNQIRRGSRVTFRQRRPTVPND